jgi:hypothetical protein
LAATTIGWPLGHSTTICSQKKEEARKAADDDGIERAKTGNLAAKMCAVKENSSSQKNFEANYSYPQFPLPSHHFSSTQKL